MGGAMDLVAGAKRVVVVMTHNDKSGAPKLLRDCTLPLTGKNCIDLIITEKAVFEVDRQAHQLVLIEKQPEFSLEDLRACTEADFRVALRDN
jgi:3-oxoacid CoA-transferase B subunit